MANNITLPATGTGTAGPVASTDQVSADSSQVQNVQLATISAGVLTRLALAIGANGGLKIEGVASGTAIPVSGSLTISGTMPVSGTDLTATGSVTSATTAASITTLAGMSSAAVQITSAGVATVTFEGTVDGSTWVAIPGQLVGGTGALVTTNGGATGIWQIDVGALAGIRARVSAYTSGTVTAFIRASNGAGSVGIDVPLPAGANSIGVVGLAAGAAAIGSVTTELATGLSTFSNTALTNTKTAVKASAGKVYGWMIHNPSAATTFIQVWNVAIGSITVGTTAPTWTIPIPAGASANVFTDRGITHSTEINIAATTTATGSTAPATAAVVSLFYI